MPQPTHLLLPDLGRGDLLVAISASFPELEDPLDNSWDLRYETSSCFCATPSLLRGRSALKQGDEKVVMSGGWWVRKVKG